MESEQDSEEKKRPSTLEDAINESQKQGDTSEKVQELLIHEKVKTLP